MFTLTVQEETIKEAFQKTLDDMFTVGNYRNPVKDILEKQLGYSGEMRGEMGKQITTFLEIAMQSPEFQQQLGKSIADEMARRAVDAMEKKNKH